jgi:hypothetical protein
VVSGFCCNGSSSMTTPGWSPFNVADDDASASEYAPTSRAGSLPDPSARKSPVTKIRFVLSLIHSERVHPAIYGGTVAQREQVLPKRVVEDGYPMLDALPAPPCVRAALASLSHASIAF